MNDTELKLFSAEVETWTPERILAWAVRRYESRVVLTCSFGGGGIVLAHMLSKHHPDAPVLFLDTGFHFPETLEFKKAFVKCFGINVLTIRPALTVDEQAAQFGEGLYARDPDLCCHMRKVQPLARALHELQVDAWISALRRDQSPTRQHVRVLEWHRIDLPNAEDAVSGEASLARQIVKIHPLAHWTRHDVWSYITEHDLPYHPLLDSGYASIGCAPCTVPTGAADDERSGRWAGTDKVECGLHTFSKKSNPPSST